MTNRQYIFCLETNRKANTDWQYIRKTLDYLNMDKQVFDKYTPLYMNGKNNYNSKSFIQQIKKTKSIYTGCSTVIFCIDLDDYSISHTTKTFVDKIERYCKVNDYLLVYYSRDIEEVYLEKRIPNNEKVENAIRFSKHGQITKNLLERLNCDTKAFKTSNFLKIYNKCFIK